MSAQKKTTVTYVEVNRSRILLRQHYCGERNAYLKILNASLNYYVYL